MSSIAAAHDLPQAVLQFCAANGLLPHVRTAMRLAEEAFAPIDRLQVSLEADPETDQQVVVIDVSLVNRVGLAREQKKNYTRRWVESAPPEARERIRLLYELP